MSTIHRFAIESQNISYGLLASSLGEILRTQPQVKLDETATNHLRQATEFIDDVIRGAECVSHGRCDSLTTERSVKALGYAMHPIKALQKVVADKDDFVQMLKHISEYLTRAAKTMSLPQEEDSNGQIQLKLAQLFFKTLAQYLLSSLSTTQTGEAPNVPLP